MRLGLRTTLQKARRDLSKLTRKVIIDKNGHKKTVYVRLGVPIKRNGSNGRNEKVEEGGTKPVQHEGEFVLTSEGSKDFGEISVEIAQAIRRQAGKIRLRIGEQDTDSERGYGEKHIERPKRKKEFKLIGFDNARDFVTYIAESYDAIYEGNSGSLILYKKGVHHTEIISRLEPSGNDEFWDVKTAFVTRQDSKRNKKPLWERSQSG